MLGQVLQGAMDERNLSARDVGKLLDVSHTTVLRAVRGEQIDLQTLIKIAEWLRIRPSALLDSFSDEDLDAKIMVLVDAHPKLKTVLESAAVAIENGQAEPGIIQDIVSYAEYRLDTGA